MFVATAPKMRMKAVPLAPTAASKPIVPVSVSTLPSVISPLTIAWM